MSFKHLRKRGSKVTLGGILATLSVATPLVWAGTVWLREQPGGSGALQASGGSWREVCTALLPNPGAVAAAALLLLPFGLSTLRRRG